MSTEEGVFSDKPQYFFLERYLDSYITELKDFFEVIHQDKEVSVSGIDWLKPVLIALAAKKSLIEGRPVKVEK